MFVSNNTRFRRMRKYNKKLQENIDDTQIKLYNYLAQQQQTDEQANQYAQMASRIGTRLIHSMEEKPTGELTGLGKLFKAINEGKLDQFIQSLQHIPTSGLSAVARVAQSVIQTKDYKQEVNTNIKKLVEVGETQPKKIASALIQELAKNPKFQERVRMQDEESVSSNELFNDVAEGAMDELSDNGKIEPSQSDTISSSVDTFLTEFPETFANSASFTTDLFKKLIEELANKLSPDKKIVINLLDSEGKTILTGTTPKFVIEPKSVSIMTGNKDKYDDLKPLSATYKKRLQEKDTFDKISISDVIRILNRANGMKPEEMNESLAV
jgi:hypothetical protein